MEKHELVEAMKNMCGKLQADGASVNDLRGMFLGLFVSLSRGILTKEQAHAGLDMVWDMHVEGGVK